MGDVNRQYAEHKAWVLTPILGVVEQHLATFQEFPVRQVGLSAEWARPSKASSRRSLESAAVRLTEREDHDMTSSSLVTACAALRRLVALCTPALAAERPPTDGLRAAVPAGAVGERGRRRRCRIRSTSGASRQSHLPKDAPNILIILLDDVGFGLPDTFGGPIHTPTLTRIAERGHQLQRLPHHVDLLADARGAADRAQPPARRLRHDRRARGRLGRLHRRDPAGPPRRSPRCSAHYGYKTAAFGKWHNTPATETTAMGPFTLWPTGEGIGFDYFYGFLAGETSQWEPRLVENFNPIEPPHDEKYHLSEDLADKAITWMRKHRAFAPDKPFLMYWAPGAGARAAPHLQGMGRQVQRQVRRRLGRAARAHLQAPEGARLDSRRHASSRRAPTTMAAWDSIPESRAAVPAAADGGLRRLRRARRRPGRQGDRRARPPRHPRQHDRLLHLRRQRLQRRRPERHHQRAAGAEPDSRTRSSSSSRRWTSSAAWTRSAGRRSTTCTTPAGRGPATRRSSYTKLIASHFGGTRNPLAISWPARIKPDKTPRSQFHHVNDIAPTIYDILGIKPPKVVDGFEQDPIDGVSMAYTFADAKAPGAQAHAVLRQQRQPRHLSRRLVSPAPSAR